MVSGLVNRRKALAIAMTVVLAGCQVVPKSGPVTTPAPQPTATGLPGDADRHRVALLVPLSGSYAEVGQAIANATTMALLDSNASNLRITTYDTATDAGSAAARAISDGNKLILGPLRADNVTPVLSRARAANVPLISFSNTASVAAPDVFVMGVTPEQSIDRTVKFARTMGATKFAILVPDGEYGAQAEQAFGAAVKASGATVVARENYSRSNTSVVSAATRLRERGGFDTLLIADGERFANLAGPAIKPNGAVAPLLLGTELWSGESSILASPALRGALFSSISDSYFRNFSDRYKARFGSTPHRIATLGYDAVLLTLRITKDWKPGRNFPIARLKDSGGFGGADGPLRFLSTGVVERAMEVRKVGDHTVEVVSAAPTRFDD